MLKRVSIQNFKSLKDVTLDLQKVNLLIGPNNSGKTNFLKALEFFGEKIFENIEKQNSLFPNNIRFSSKYLYQKNDNHKLYIHLIFNENIISDHTQISLFDERFKYQHFRLKDEKLNYYFEHWYSNEDNIVKDSFRGVNYSISREYADFYFKEIKAFTINPYLVTGPYPLLRNSEYLKSDTSNIVAYLDTIRDKYPEIFYQIERDINVFVPEFNQIRFDNILPDKDLKKIYGDKTYKNFGLYNKIQQTTYFADELSEGTIYFVILLCIIYQPIPPKILLIEEPERGIHPRRIHEVMNFIFRLADEKDIQIVLTSHNENVLNEFTSMPEAVFVFNKDEEGGTYVHNLKRDIIDPSHERSRQEGLEEIDFTDDLGKNWMYGLLGGVPTEEL